MNSLQKPVLVLNKNWQPVHVATVARALVLLWKECCARRRRGRLPDVLVGRLVEAAPASGEPFMSGVNFRLRVPEVITLTELRSAADARGDVQPAEHFQARPLSVPVLRREPGRRGADDRPRRSARPGRRLELDELRACLHRLQQAQGRPHAEAGGDEPQEGPACPTWRPVYADHRTRLESWSKFISEAYWNVELAK